MSKDNSHQVSESMMTGNNSYSDIHNGAGVLSNDGQTFAPGSAGMGQGLGGDMFKNFKPNMNSILGENNSLVSITQLQIDDNLLSSVEGFGPVQGLNAASQMGNFSSMPAIELKNAGGAIGADLRGNTGLISPQKGGQSH